jgi:hypothetical protein
MLIITKMLGMIGKGVQSSLNTGIYLATCRTTYSLM